MFKGTESGQAILANDEIIRHMALVPWEINSLCPLSHGRTTDLVSASAIMSLRQIWSDVPIVIDSDIRLDPLHVFHDKQSMARLTELNCKVVSNPLDDKGILCPAGSL